MSDETKRLDMQESGKTEEKKDAEGQGMYHLYCPKCGNTWWSPNWDNYCPKWGCYGKPERM